MPFEVAGQLGSVIRTRRLTRSMTLARVAELVGCAKSYLSLIENGHKTAPSDDLLIALEQALGFDEGELLERARWARTPPEVRSAYEQLEIRERAAQRLAEIIEGGGIDNKGRVRGALDIAYRTGELRRLVERISPTQRDNTVALPAEVPLINSVAAGYPREFTDLGYPVRIADEYIRTPDLHDPDAFAARVVGESMLPEYRQGDIVVFSPMRDPVDGNDCFVRLEPDHESTFKRVYFETGEHGEELIRLQPINNAFPPRTLAREQVAGLYPAVSVTRSLI